MLNILENHSFLTEQLFAINYSVTTLQIFCTINCSIVHTYLKIYASV